MAALLVNEIFWSLQGEGAFTGTPSVFFRLQGCSVGCPWCDTGYAQKCDPRDRLPDQSPVVLEKNIRDRTDDQPVEIRPSGAVLQGAEGCSVFPEGFSGALSVRAKGRDEPHPRDDAAVHGSLRLFPGYRRPRPCRKPRRRGLRGARDRRARRRCRRHGRRRATGIF